MYDKLVSLRVVPLQKGQLSGFMARGVAQIFWPTERGAGGVKLQELVGGSSSRSSPWSFAFGVGPAAVDRM